MNSDPYPWQTRPCVKPGFLDDRCIPVERRIPPRKCRTPDKLVGARPQTQLKTNLSTEELKGDLERVCVGHQRELAGIAIPDLQVFVVQELESIAGADFKQIPRKPVHLAAIAGNAEGDAALALLGHGVAQIVKLAIADQVLSVGLRDYSVRLITERNTDSSYNQWLQTRRLQHRG